MNTVNRGIQLLNQIEFQSQRANNPWENKQVVFSANSMQARAEKEFNKLGADVKRESRSKWAGE